MYVALSGTPVKSPPQLDAKGNPVFEKKKGKEDDDDDDAGADKSADGVGVIDVASRKLTGKIKAGSDPEEFDLSKDGKQIYISNEDVKTASIVNIAASKVEHHHSHRAGAGGCHHHPGRQAFLRHLRGWRRYLCDR